jgi:pimeloyl-ACP methyl ester carboxylesterase
MKIENLNALRWLEQGSMINVHGHDHFVYDSRTDKPVLLILHGFPTSSYDYHKALPLLEQHFRVVVHDHLGFGLSDKPINYSYSLIEQTDQAIQLWRSLGISGGVVLAHDYGTSIATEILARSNRFGENEFKIQAMVLCNGSVHIEMAQLRLIQKLLGHPVLGPVVARMSTKSTFARNIKGIYFDADRVMQDEIDAMWAMMEHKAGRKILSQVAQYPKERYKFWHRWIGALQCTQVPIKVIWAMNDPIAVPKIARTIADEVQNSELIELENMGHFPMLESPDLWSDAVIRALQ